MADRALSAHGLPSFVKAFLGSHRDLCLQRLDKAAFGIVCTATGRGVIVAARTASEARGRIVEFVSHAAPRTDRRRRIWCYT